ncbi:MAG: AmmeMemoRadiSam system protein B [Candidatus Omnitrophota bacterium]
MTQNQSSTPLESEYPTLRPVDIYPVHHNGQQSICLRDPQNIAKNILILPLPAFFLVSLFDGKHSILDIQESFMRQFQQLAPRKNIEEMIAQLDRELFLETNRFRQALDKIKEDFRAAPIREAAHAGTAYDADPASLRERLSGFMQDAAVKAENRVTAAERLTALIAPHIDIQRGGLCFAQAYRELARHKPSDLYVIFGTAHQSRSSLFAATAKSYATPLGAIETDADFVERFSREAPVDVFAEEVLHRDEHSIEFQAVWLRFVLGENWRGKMVPILCGSFHPFVQSGRSPREDANMAETLDLLQSLIKEYPGTVTVIAGADMSHVGKRFGSERGIPDSELDRVKREDEEVLEAMISGDAEAFYRCVEKNKDRNNLCGLSPIYMTLDVARPPVGRLLKYDRAIERDSESVVTFASASFYDR